MNGIHDMGGMHGFGAMEREDHEPVFHHEWEGRVFGMFLSTQVTVPEGKRYKIETMEPQQYLTASYYERWMQACIQACIDAGVLTAEDLTTRMSQLRDHPDTAIPHREDPERLARWIERMRAPRTIRRETDRSHLPLAMPYGPEISTPSARAPLCAWTTGRDYPVLRLSRRARSSAARHRSPTRAGLCRSL